MRKRKKVPVGFLYRLDRLSTLGLAGPEAEAI
jgi:hypothetical protein